MEPKQTVTGQTHDAGFQVGVRRTLPIAYDEAWRLITGAAGLRLWLGEAGHLRLAKGARYQLADGAHGEVRVYQPNHHLRLTWQPTGWERPSTIQVRVLPKGASTTIAFHHEGLPDSAAREQRRRHYEAVLRELEQQLPAS